MLKVTENAQQAIESIVANADVPEGAGIRIDTPDETRAPAPSGAPLQLEIAGQPAEDDQVVARNGAKVFVSPDAAPILDDKVLDVRVAEDRVEFVIRPQAPPGSPGMPGMPG